MTVSENPNAPGKLPLWRLLAEIALLLAVLILAGLQLFPRTAPVSPEATSETVLETSAPSPSPTPASLAVRLHGVTDTETLYIASGETFLPEEAPMEGYTFLRWETGQGEAIGPAGTVVREELDLYPVYAMKLGRKDHAPYLSLDEEGAFHPADPLTRREVVQTLYFLLDTKLVGDGSFLDLPEEDELYPAAATLKQLGVLTGARLHPDETVTRRDFLGMLCAFFPQSGETVQFSDLSPRDRDYPLFCSAAALGWIECGEEIPARPDEELTRLEFVSMLSTAMDRHGDQDRRQELVGTILDMRADDPHFWDVAEAVIPHRASGTGAEERWKRSTPVPTREEGLFFLGTELHAIDESGNPVINGSYAGLSFDAAGIVTSGDPELDALVREVLEDLVDPSTMEGEDMLEEAFYYVVVQLRYRMGNYYPPGEPAGWEIAEAKTALRDKAGNCYSFAASFCVLARALGYPAQAYTGSVRTENPGKLNIYTDIHGTKIELPADRCPHGWVEIEIDGEPLVFDPEMVYHLRAKGNNTSTVFMADASIHSQYGYSTELEVLPSPSPKASPVPDTAPQKKPVLGAYSIKKLF